MLRISARDIRRHGPGHLLAVCWRQWRAERALARRGIHFRTTDLAQLAVAYTAMTAEEFAAINGRQDWANWRTIPRALSGEVPDRPLQVLDLGSGIGSSTQVLAFYCPAGSHITGYELAWPLVKIARRRNYRRRSGQPAGVAFVCQGVTEPLRTPAGALVADHSVDVANASGVVGHHLTPQTVPPLLAELRRVLVPGGVALLDVGPTLQASHLDQLMYAAGFEVRGRRRSWRFDPTGQVVYRAAVS
jgi:SAM-dependent methyltransferase